MGGEPRVTQDKYLTAEKPDIACRRRGGERGEQATLGPEPKGPSEPVVVLLGTAGAQQGHNGAL